MLILKRARVFSTARPAFTLILTIMELQAQIKHVWLRAGLTTLLTICRIMEFACMFALMILHCLEIPWAERVCAWKFAKKEVMEIKGQPRREASGIVYPHALLVGLLKMTLCEDVCWFVTAQLLETIFQIQPTRFVLIRCCAHQITLEINRLICV